MACPAHDIRNRSTKQFQAVSSLSAQHRWCLTGTPIQNNLEDLGTLVAFLKVPILENAPTFRKFIISPITSTSKARFQNLRTLLRTVCLRRTRELLDLPEPIPQIRRLPLTPPERAEYDDLLLQCRREIDMVVSGRRKRKINSTVLESLLKLRLFCNNGNTNAVLCTGPTGLPADPDEALTYLQQYDQNVCANCSGIIYSISDIEEAGGGTFISSCYHLVCHSCMPYYHAQREDCPSCASGNEPISSSNHPQIQSSRRSENAGGLYHGQYPSKLLALFSDISEHPSHKRYLILHGHPFDLIELTVQTSASYFLAGRRLLVLLENFSIAMQYDTT
jgi:SWI/SNF-related matrix-associated actin-dependent regulator of chromatin subfamily A3